MPEELTGSGDGQEEVGEENNDDPVSDLPEQYNSVDLGYITPIKDQLCLYA